MKIDRWLPGEEDDVRRAVMIGDRWGFGNVIRELHKAWADRLERNGMSRQAAERGARMWCVWCGANAETGKKPEGGAA